MAILRAKNILVVAALVAAAFMTLLIVQEVRGDCGLTELEARKMVLADVQRRGLPAAGLSAPRARANCPFDYEYVGGGERIDYSVIYSSLHGPKVTSYDHSVPGN